MLGEAWLIIIDGGGDGEKVSCAGPDHSNKSDLTDIEYCRTTGQDEEVISAKPGPTKAQRLKSSIHWVALLTKIP